MNTLPRLMARSALVASALCWSLHAAAATPSDYAMPYTNTEAATDTFKGITLVSSADFAQSSELVPFATTVGAPHIVSGGDVSGGELRNVRPHSLVFAQANRWMRAPLRNGLTPTPVRFSSEAAANSACSALVIYRDFAAPTTAALFYALPGVNAACGAGVLDEDDVVRWVGINAASGVAPSTMTGWDSLHLSPIYKTSGQLHAIYTLQAGSVLRLASNLTTISTVRAGVSQFQVVGQLPDLTVIAIIDGVLERIKPGGTLYPKPLRRPKAGYHIDQALLHGSEVFFAEKAVDSGEAIQTRISRIAVDGASAAVLMLTLKDTTYMHGFTTQRLIYTVGDSVESDMTLYSFPKDGSKGSAPQTRIYKAAMPNVLTVFTTRGNNVFFNVSGFAFTFPPVVTYIAMVKSDLGVSVKNYGAFSGFLGGQITDSGAGAFEEQETYARLLLATKGVSGSYGIVGPKLYSLDPATITTDLLTDLPDHLQPLFAIGFGPGSIGAEINLDNGKSDVFAFDLIVPRFRQLTDGTARSEFPAF